MSRGAGAPVSGDATGEDFWAADVTRVEFSRRCGGGRGMSRGAGAPVSGDATGEDLWAADAKAIDMTKIVSEAAV
jgi:hypothetical protein